MASPLKRATLPVPKGEEAKNPQHEANLENVARSMMGYFERFERYECQEALAQTSCNWTLSTDDFRLATEPPCGLITSMLPTTEKSFLFLLPQDIGDKNLCLREIHQIVRELTIGIFVLNQVPSISLEANFESSTAVQLPQAYIDTKVGQLLSDVDYLLKGLWHGVYFPREKRIKFSERWRVNFDVDNNGIPQTKKNLLDEFRLAGMVDITEEFPDRNGCLTDTSSDLSNNTTMLTEAFEDINLQLTFYQKSVLQHRNLFVVDAAWSVSNAIRLTDEVILQPSFEKLNHALRQYHSYIEQNMEMKVEVKRQMRLLRLISFLVPFLIAMRKKMKIPDLTMLLPPLVGDEVRTERDFPPLITDRVKQEKPLFQQYTHLHGGIMIDQETDVPVAPSQVIVDRYGDVLKTVEEYNNLCRQPEFSLQENYQVPTIEIEGSLYSVLSLELDTFYPQAPQRPKWVFTVSDEMNKLKLKRLPVSDVNIHEQFKKYFGYKRAIKCKVAHIGLRASTKRGLVAIFTSLTRKGPASRLAKHDERGLTLMHYAAIHNRPRILALLLLHGMDINTRRSSSSNSTGPTALHLGSRCGSLDAVACLMASGANSLLPDQFGWAPIHYAAFYDHPETVRYMIRRSDTLLELNTRDESRTTPLLLATSSGALASLKCLMMLGANVTRFDELGNNVVNLAALRLHSDVLVYLIQLNHPGVDVWKILISMLCVEEFDRQLASVRCLEILSVSSITYWKSILNADGVAALVRLCDCDDDGMVSIAVSVLCNISEHEPVRQALTQAKAGTILVKMLQSSTVDIQSRAAIVLADLACVDENQSHIANINGIESLIQLLDSDLEDVLVNSVNAIRVICDNHPENQTLITESDAIDLLVQFLSVDSLILQAASSSALSAIAKDHPTNQNLILGIGAVRPLVDLVLAKNVTVQVKAANAIECLVTGNSNSQKAFLKVKAEMALIRLLKIWSIEVKEQGALTLWAIAGNTPDQQQLIAEQIGIQTLIEIIMLNSDNLQYVGCQAMMALAWENMTAQKMIGCDGIQPLVRLIRSGRASLRVLRSSIQTLGVLCLGVAHSNNKLTQNLIVAENSLTILVSLLNNPPNAMIQVDVAYSIACIVLGNAHNQQLLKENPLFSIQILLDLFHSGNEDIILKAGHALTLFAFNNTDQQYCIREAGGLKISSYLPFLRGRDSQKCKAAFQIVILARCIVDDNQVSLTALGVQKLVEVLKSTDDNAVILAGSMISSLAHTRAGVPEAIITSGAMSVLINLLLSPIERIRSTAAVAVGYLSFNRTAARELLSACRGSPGIYKSVMENIGKNPKICNEFLDEFRRAKIVGLPSLSLEKNGGPSVLGHSKDRPKTAATRSRPGTAREPVCRLRLHDVTRSRRTDSAPPGGSLYRSLKTLQTIQSIQTKSSTKLSQARNAETNFRKIVKTNRPMVKIAEVEIGSVFQTKLDSWED